MKAPLLYVNHYNVNDDCMSTQYVLIHLFPFAGLLLNSSSCRVWLPARLSLECGILRYGKDTKSSTQTNRHIKNGRAGGCNKVCEGIHKGWGTHSKHTCAFDDNYDGQVPPRHHVDSRLNGMNPLMRHACARWWRRGLRNNFLPRLHSNTTACQSGGSIHDHSKPQKNIPGDNDPCCRAQIASIFQIKLSWLPLTVGIFPNW